MAETLVGADRYGLLDRMLHRVAFSHPALQRVLGDLENDMFKRQLAAVRVERPVFVTGLPRAGTTLLLELLHGTGEFASFTYRQMPFVLAPLLWNRLSARSRRPEERHERAHGDAMTIGFDSPEAFEEVLWINRLSDVLFDDGHLRPLAPGDLTEEFRTAFRQLAAKLVCLSGGRYLSKNNANVARLSALASVFDDATILCCFRSPAAHVASLHEQHVRFLAMHDDDAFAERYMAWIGHHDFGRNFRPIRFDRTIDVPATEPLFWLRYWIDGYRHVLEHAPPQLHLVDFEELLGDGERVLGDLARTTSLERPAALVDAATTLRAPTSTPVPLAALSPTLADEADALHEELRARARQRSPATV